MSEINTVIQMLHAMEQARAQDAQAAHKRFDFIEAKLNIIEKNTVTIMGSVVSDFTGISEATKTQIETLGNEIDSEEIKDFVVNPQFTRKAHRNAAGTLVEKRVLAPSFKLTQYFNELGINTKGDRTSCGKWVGSVLAKIFQIRFNGRYSPKLEDLSKTLVDYYFVERTSPLRY
jgi:hypothetical protein